MLGGVGGCGEGLVLLGSSCKRGIDGNWNRDMGWRRRVYVHLMI